MKTIEFDELRNGRKLYIVARVNSRGRPVGFALRVGDRLLISDCPTLMVRDHAYDLLAELGRNELKGITERKACIAYARNARGWEIYEVTDSSW